MEKEQKSLILIDDSNFFYGLKKHGLKLDYRKFYFWLQKEFNPIEIIYFGGLITKKAYFSMHSTNIDFLSGLISLEEYLNHTDFEKETYELKNAFNEELKKRNEFFNVLKKIRYTIITKPVDCLFDFKIKCHKRKCNFDVEITIQALKKIMQYNHLILCSGDGDFTALVRYIKGEHKKVTVIALKDRIHFKLKKAANEIRYIDSLEKGIIKKRI